MRVLISGGGIAGPALAWWLHRSGADVTIVERAPGVRPGGHAVDVRGVAKGVIERMGLREAIRAEQVDERGIAMVDAKNQALGRMSADLFGGEGIVAEIEIARGDLARILYEATAEHTRYLFGDRITALTQNPAQDPAQDPAGVDVTFASGGTERYDIVVGADGVHSGVRALAFGPEDDYVRPLGAYGGYFTVPDPGDLDHWALMYNAPGGRVALLRPDRHGTAMASLAFRTDRRLGRLEPGQQQRIIADRMAGAGWKVASLVAEMPAASDFFFDEISRVHVDRWWRGRVVLLGDAGYCGSPLAGLGTSMSLTGAYVLAGELATAAGPERAFASYQEQMAAYVKAGLELPPGGIRGWAPDSGLMIRLRAKSMGMMSHWPMKQMLAKQFSKAEAITLKDYASATADT
jgi:2-polyprenyl-6-methoxyphenol hydroxylase-like FAD-dependent oxidoreductase